MRIGLWFRRFRRTRSVWVLLYPRARHQLLRCLRPIFWCLLRLLPSRSYAVIHGWPTLEGNVVELLPHLVRRYPHHVFWLVDGDPVAARRYVSQRGIRNIDVVPKKTLRAVWVALTAELTFFTHGLFTAVRPPVNRLVVNLWHGDGPKSTTQAGDIVSTVAVAGARMWREYKAEIFGLRVGDVALSGNPRSDALLRGMRTDQWERLGYHSNEALVLWLPTYRMGRNAEGLLWRNGAPLSTRADLGDLHEVALHTGVSLVVKPHPMDLDDYTRLGLRVLTDADLQEADVALYELLGSCSALISDTSSVWVDFLALGRPVAFFLPDAEELARTRGFNVPDLLAILPGPVLSDVHELRDYLQALTRDPMDPRLIREERRAEIGPAPLGDACERLLNWLDEYQAARGRPPLFQGGHDEPLPRPREPARRSDAHPGHER